MQYSKYFSCNNAYDLCSAVLINLLGDVFLSFLPHLNLEEGILEVLTPFRNFQKGGHRKRTYERERMALPSTGFVVLATIRVPHPLYTCMTICYILSRSPHAFNNFTTAFCWDFTVTQNREDRLPAPSLQNNHTVNMLFNKIIVLIMKTVSITVVLTIPPF